MGRKCSIINCCSRNSGVRVSLFKPPGNMYKKWAEALKISGNTIPQNCYVCEKHFLKENIIKERLLKDISGNILLQRPLKNPRLSPTAIPTIFNNYDENKENSYDGSTKNLQPLLTVAQDSLSDPTSNTTPVNCVSVIDDETENVSSINSDTSKNSIIEREFSEIFSNCHYITSSNNQWAIHKVDEPRRLLIAAKITPLFTEKLEAPIIEKQIVMEENGKCQTFILNKLLDLGDNYVNSLEEFQLLIGKVDSWHICVGGPSIFQYENVHSMTAYKDVTNKWRHNLCKLLLETGTICKECVKVEITLRKYLAYANKRKYPAKVHLALSPIQRAHIKDLKKAAHVTTQALKRYKMKCKTMKDEIRNARNEIAKICK